MTPFWLHMTYNTLFLCLALPYGPWNISNELMPRGDGKMAVGSHDNSIYLLGGYIHNFQLTRYDIATNTMIDCGSNNLTNALYGNAQFYSVTNNIIFMVTVFDSKLSAFDLRTLSFLNYGTDLDMSPPHQANKGSCIESTDGFLYVIGGESDDHVFSNILQILAMNTNTWSTKEMHVERGCPTCNVHPQNDMLYIIGGRNKPSKDYEFLDSIEVINTSNIHFQTWEYNIGKLLYASSHQRSIIYETTILVLGGFTNIAEVPDTHLDTVQLIDVTTGLVSEGTPLNYRLYLHSAIIVENIFYVFGGYSPNRNGQPGWVNKWQYFIAPPIPTTTISPTSAVIIPITTNFAETLTPNQSNVSSQFTTTALHRELERRANLET
eukprot:946760_1